MSFQRILALILFILLPIFAFFLGMRYQSSQSYTLPSPTIITTTPGSYYPTPTSGGPSCCSPEQLQMGYQCIQGCGPPVAREGYPTPPYFCASPDQVRMRARGVGCPICLSSLTMIKTPAGEVDVKNIRVGTKVWSVDENGEEIVVPVLKIASVQVRPNHQMIHLLLSDGRELWASPGHPTIDGKTVDQLRQGEKYDGSTISKTEMVAYGDSRTYDLLPAGETGFYFANGILLGSTLK